MRLIAHLPGYRLADGGPTAFGPGRLVHLTADEWRELDDAYPFQSHRYEGTSPLFLEVADEDAGVTGNGDDSDRDPSTRLRAFLAGPATLVHLALALRGAQPDRLPAPPMSIGYLHRNGGTLRLVGPHERSALLHGLPLDDPPDPLDTTDLAHAATVHGLLEATVDDDAVAALVAACEITARLDVDAVTGLCLNVAAIETALLPDIRSGLRAAFARRVGTLVEPDPSQAPAAAAAAGDIYRLRGDVLHGRVRDSSLERLGLPTLAALSPDHVRSLVRVVLLRLAACLRGGLAVDELRPLLDVADHDGAARDRVAEAVAAGLSSAATSPGGTP